MGNALETTPVAGFCCYNTEQRKMMKHEEEKSDILPANLNELYKN